MTGDEVLDLLRAAINTVLEVEPGTVTRSSRLVEDLQADSLAIVEVVEILEEQLAALTGRALRIDDEALDDLLTVGDAVDQVLAQL